MQWWGLFLIESVIIGHNFFRMPPFPVSGVSIMVHTVTLRNPIDRGTRFRERGTLDR